jgi:hypothetical protein
MPRPIQSALPHHPPPPSPATTHTPPTDPQVRRSLSARTQNRSNAANIYYAAGMKRGVATRF